MVVTLLAVMAPTTARPAQAGAIQSKLLSPRASSDGYLLTKSYGRGDFDLEFEVTCNKPGSVFDTVGINAAPVGSWSVGINGDYHLTFNLWDGRKWHQLTSQATLGRGKRAVVRLERQGPTVRFSVDSRKDVTGQMPVLLSGMPIYVGDFKGDESWGGKYNIHQGFIGSVRVLYFGDTRTLWTAAATTNPPVAVPQKAESPQKSPAAENTKREPPADRGQFANVVVSSEPQDCEVSVNGMLIGTTPVMLKLPDGVHVIQIAKAGYQPARKELRAFAGSDSMLKVKLEPQ